MPHALAPAKYLMRYAAPMTTLRTSLFIIGLFLGSSLSQAQSTIPFVGCPSDGQTGPLAPPPGAPLKLNIPPADAQKLAYYSSENGPNVLGPRGWHCFATYGSNGSSLYLSPDPITTQDFFNSKAKWKGLTGDGIEFSISIGDTSGRFEVARIVARVFPAYYAFSKAVAAEKSGFSPKLTFGPWPGDKLTYKSNELLEFQTPAGLDGLGTASWLKPGSQAISGMVFFDNHGDRALYHLSVRLPSALAPLASDIIRIAEHEASTTRAPYR